MPVFRMVCDTCGLEKKKLLKKPEPFLCSACTDGKMIPQLPTSLSTVTKELRDPHRGVSLEKGHDKLMKKRMNQYHDKYEAERKIDEFGIDDAKRLGWDKKVKRI